MDEGKSGRRQGTRSFPHVFFIFLFKGPFSLGLSWCVVRGECLMHEIVGKCFLNKKIHNDFLQKFMDSVDRWENF